MKLFFSIGLMLFGFFFIFEVSSFWHALPDYEQIADKITEKTAKKLEKQRNLCLIGTGGRMMDDIQMMAMSFHFYQEVDLKKARELLIYVINEYLSDINGNEEVRPYLHEYPFTAKNVEIRIWAYNHDRSRLSSEKIYYISAIDGILDYYIRGPEEYSRQAICEETYEEALKIVNADSV